MDDRDLPEVDSQKKKERKGFLPWLKQRLGFGRSASMGNLPSHGAMNVGRIGNIDRIGNIGRIGAARTGLAALVSRVSALLPMAIVALGVGTVFYMRSARDSAPSNNVSMGDSSQTVKNRNLDYVPAILRQQNDATSSLDVFKEANKGKMSSDEQQPEAKDEKAPEEQVSSDANAGEQPSVRDEVNAKLQGVARMSLSGGVGGGSGFGASSAFSALGGFGNNFGKFGPEVGFSNMGSMGSVGSGFSNLPKFQDRKNKLLAMSSKKFGVSGTSRISVKKGNAGRSLGRAQAIRNTMRSYQGGNSDTLRATSDAAWEGTTGEGAVSPGGVGLNGGRGGGRGSGGGGGRGSGGGAGGELSNGGAGIVETPSSINDVTPGGGGTDDYSYPDTTGYSVDNPWGNMLDRALMYLMLAAGLAFAGSLLIKAGKSAGPWGIALMIAGWIMSIAALMLAIKVIMSAMDLMGKYGQAKLGTIYLIAGMAAAASAGLAMAGQWSAGAAGYVSYFAGAAAILALLGSMAAGSAMGKYKGDTTKYHSQGKTLDKDKGERR